MSETVPVSRFAVGDFVIDASYDESIGQYVGAVRNKPYPVKLAAPTVAEVETKFETLLTTYLGVGTA